jgi:hypothetical protein
MLLKKKEKTTSRARGLRVFRLAFEPLSYDACSILNAIPGNLHKPFDRPLHRRLQGDAGVTAPEAHEKVVACARARPSSSRQLPMASSSWDIFLLVESRSGSTMPASGAMSPPQTGLKLKDARAASAWPKKL